MENFSFLKNDYPELYLLCSDVAKYIDSDKSISMLKARQAIEYIVKYLGAETDELFDNINNLEDKNIASSRIIDLFHLIRKKANKSVHDAVNADTEGVLDALTELCFWLVVEHDKNNIDDNNNFLKKYKSHDIKFNNSVSAADATNPLEITGDFSNKEGFEEEDVFDQDVFETKEEYYKRIESLPGIKIGYAFLEASQIDEYCNIAFPLFHISKHPKIESAEIAAFYVSIKGTDNSINIDGIIKAKLKIFEDKIYYDYDSVVLQDDEKFVKLYPVSWEKYGYETKEQFANRINNLPLLPVGIAKPIRQSYSLKNQVLPFETIPMAYVSKVFKREIYFCLINRDEAKEICSIKSSFKAYAYLKCLSLLKGFDNFYIPSLQILTSLNNSLLYAYREIEMRNIIEFNSSLDLAKQGDSTAQYNLARCYYFGSGTEKDTEKAVEWYKKAAEQGNASAQLELARCYYFGSGTEKDTEKAFEWYKKAAEQGEFHAKRDLIEHYELEFLINKMGDEAIEWTNKLAIDGNGSAKYKLNYMLAKSGDSTAQRNLARCYYSGNGTKEDTEKAFEWYKKAAEQGNVDAVSDLVSYYELEFLIENMSDKAFEKIRVIAADGEAKAQHVLAYYYYTKNHVREALKWYSRAADQNYYGSKFYNTGNLIDDANNGNSNAQYCLGKIYEDDNILAALYWYHKGASQHDTRCQRRFHELYGSNAFDGIENKDFLKYILFFFVAIIVWLCFSKYL